MAYQFQGDIGENNPKLSLHLNTPALGYLKQYMSDWGYGNKLGRLYTKEKHVPCSWAVTHAVKDFEDNFEVNKTIIKPLNPDEVREALGNVEEEPPEKETRTPEKKRSKEEVRAVLKSALLAAASPAKSGINRRDSVYVLEKDAPPPRLSLGADPSGRLSLAGGGGGADPANAFSPPARAIAPALPEFQGLYDSPQGKVETFVSGQTGGLYYRDSTSGRWLEVTDAKAQFKLPEIVGSWRVSTGRDAGMSVAVYYDPETRYSYRYEGTKRRIVDNPLPIDPQARP